MDFSEKTPFPKDPFFRTRQAYCAASAQQLNRASLAMRPEKRPLRMLVTGASLGPWMVEDPQRG